MFVLLLVLVKTKVTESRQMQRQELPHVMHSTIFMEKSSVAAGSRHTPDQVSAQCELAMFGGQGGANGRGNPTADRKNCSGGDFQAPGHGCGRGAGVKRVSRGEGAGDPSWRFLLTTCCNHNTHDTVGAS